MKKLFLALVLILFMAGAGAFFFRERIYFHFYFQPMVKTLENRLHVLLGHAFIRSAVYTGDYVYAGTFSHLYVFHARLNKRLLLEKKIRLRGIVMALARDENTLFAITKVNGVYVFDISMPARPRMLARVPVQGLAFLNSATATKGFLYVSTEKGLLVMDAREGKHPKIVQHIDTGALNEMFVSRYTLYAAQPSKGLAIFDIRDPENSVFLGSIMLHSPSKDNPVPSIIPPTSVAVVNNTAFVTNGYEGVAVMDVTNPRKPGPVRHILQGNYCDGISRIGNYVAVTLLPDTLALINVNDPDMPVVEKRLKGISLPPEGIQHKQAIIIQNPTSLSLVSLKHPYLPKILSTFRLKPLYYAVKADDYFVFLSRGDGRIHIYRRSPPENPTYVSTFKTSGIPTDIAVAGEHLYVANSFPGSMDVIDVRYPEKPASRAVFNAEQMNSGAAIRNNLLFVAAWDRGISMYNVSAPGKPVFLASTLNEASLSRQDAPIVLSVAVKENMVFGAGLAGSSVVAAFKEESKTLSLVSILPVEGKETAIYGQTAYVAGFEKGIHALDVKDPVRPILLATLLAKEFPVALDVEGNHLFVADYKKGVFMVDIRRPSEPRIATFYQTQGHPRDVDAVGNICYVADETYGLAVINTSTGTVTYPSRD